MCCQRYGTRQVTGAMRCVSWLAHGQGRRSNRLGRGGPGALRALGSEVDDLGRDLAGFLLQPLALGIACGDVAVDLAALAALAPALHPSRGRPEMLRRLVDEAPVTMAAMIGPEVEAGVLVGRIHRVGPLQAQPRHIGRQRRNPGNLNLAVPPFDLLANAVLVGDLPETGRSQLAVTDQHMGVMVPLVASEAGEVQGHVERDADLTLAQNQGMRHMPRLNPADKMTALLKKQEEIANQLKQLKAREKLPKCRKGGDQRVASQIQGHADMLLRLRAGNKSLPVAVGITVKISFNGIQ
jgi:hypothetical protein